ncbi:MAG: ABC transporter ATP-binding protein [Clostridia bacterium]|nr:ABC transporter ATP-binding protein [Clostridia bacterium]
MSYIKIKNAVKKINGNLILDNINLELEKNKVYGFVGVNGSGKTMLFRAIAGLIKLNAGEIIVDGVKIEKGKHPEKTGLLIENADLWSELTAKENLEILNSMSESKVKAETIEKLLTYFDLDYKSKKVYKHFSLGMKQKLRLAQVFMGEPELLIIDEPTNALDENSVEKFKNLIVERKNNGATILIASHSKYDINSLCDEVIYISEGKIVKTEKGVEKNGQI